MKEANFKFRKSFYTAMSDMTDKQRSEFIRGICEYVFDGKPFQTKDPYLKGVFLYVKKELDDSMQKSLNGRKGGIVCAEKRAKRREERNGFQDVTQMISEEILCEIPLMEILEVYFQNDCELKKKEGKVLHGKGKQQAG